MDTKTKEIGSPNEMGVASSFQSAIARPKHAIVLALLCAFFCEMGLVPLSEKYSWSPLESLGRILFTSLVVFALHSFSSLSFRLYKPSIKNLGFLGFSLILTLVMVSISGLISISLSDYVMTRLNLKIRPESFFFAMPFATGALMLQSVLGLHYVMVYAIILGLSLAIYLPAAPLFAAVCVVTSLVGSLCLMRCRSRSSFTKAGLNISLIVFALGFFVCLSSGRIVSWDSLTVLVCALLSGVICAFLAAGLAPIVEHAGGYITDMRLIEMATIDHPLLKELSIQAPGTWNHSMVIGMMVEAAADAIGANPVLARVGAYFHDIGKLKKPLYFVENSGGENRHEKLSPSMSALIIRSHVKEGAELALQHKLPQAISDMIPQHHGTARIEFFYDKARKEAEEAGADPDLVDESLYRYPGPKPQTREAGILMLADGIEAASRTLSEPTFDRIQGLVQKLINRVFTSGELNECDLTLRDLHVIAKSFTRVLSGIYHQRIAYAEPAEKVKISETKNENKSGQENKSSSTEEDKELAGESSSKKGRDLGPSSNSGSVEATSKEDLKRLGITHH